MAVWSFPFMVMLGSVYVPMPGWVVAQWTSTYPSPTNIIIIVTTSPDSRPSVSPGHPISVQRVRGVSEILVHVWFLTK
jgi:hypothetical protein